MKDYLIELVSRVADGRSKVSIMREYLQLYALRVIHEKGYFAGLAFVGGTALRFMYNLPRFSEDLDFSLVNEKGYNFQNILGKIKQSFLDAAYSIAIKYDDSKTVNAAFLKFPELMYLAGLTHRKDQNLTIKIDIDTRPPAGADLQQSLINKYFPIMFNHYDLPSLLSGKLHAILTRKYVKGRDYFDLWWALSRWKDTVPNFGLLNNALKQTGYHEILSADNWKGKVLEKIQQADWKIIAGDVERFVEDARDIETMNKSNLEILLSSY